MPIFDYRTEGKAMKQEIKIIESMFKTHKSYLPKKYLQRGGGLLHLVSKQGRRTKAF
jgi:hypothetical protein